MVKNTPFTEKHEALGAKMVEFAGYNMPIRYASINEEHQTVREGVGVFDVSHMGEFIIKGAGAFELVQRITSNDISVLSPGKAQYSCMPNNDGGIVDDLLVYHLPDNNYMLVVNGSNIDKDWAWLQKHNTANVETVNISDSTALLAVQGPKAIEALESLTSVDLKAMEYYTFEKGDFAGCDNVLISATGYTGSGGFEIYVNEKDAVKVWEGIFKAGAAHGIRPIGLGARDTLRLEMGFCLYGNDIDDTTSPLEAGLGWITKFNDGNQFVNSDALAEQKAAGISKKLQAFEMTERGIPRQGYAIVDVEGNSIGRVTSGTQSPSTGRAIGLAYIPKAIAKSGNEIFVEIRGKKVKAMTVKLPFYKA